MLQRLTRPVLTILVPLAALYGFEPAMTQHLLATAIGPFKSVFDLVTRTH